MAEGEIYELEAQKAKEELNRVQAESNLKLALLDLAQIMEIENVSDLDVTAPPVEQHISESLLLSAEAVYESALVNRPEISSANFRLERRSKEVLMSKAQLFPTLSFGANMGYRLLSHEQSHKRFVPFAIAKQHEPIPSASTCEYPFSTRFQVRNSIQNAQIAVENNRLEMDKTKLDLRKRIEQAYYNALGAKSRWEAAKNRK